MNVIATELPDVFLIEPKVFGDERGFFMETFNAERYGEAGVKDVFVQDNLSFSRRGVLRGLHLQNPNPQGKLVFVLQGEVFDVAVDVRVGSPTFGQWIGAYLSRTNHRQLWIPEGYAHGFCVLSDHALFAYKCTKPYAPANELSIRWDDPDLRIHWPVGNPELSQKDCNAVFLRDIGPERLPNF